MKNFSSHEFIELRDFLVTNGKEEVWSQKYGAGNCYQLAGLKVRLIYIKRNQELWPETIFINQDDQRFDFKIQQVQGKIYFTDHSNFYFHRALTPQEFFHRSNKPALLGAKGNPAFVPALTLRSTRTPPALPYALSQLLAFSAPLSASVQAGPVSFIR